jgi:hypothetical protein
MGAVKVAPLLVSVLLLVGCGDSDDGRAAERISLDQARARPAEPLTSPDTKNAKWTVRGNGQAVDFGPTPTAALLSLECNLRASPVTLAVVRHAPARPGEQALFAVLGNGPIARLPLDAELEAGEWRWQGILPASDPQLDVFVGQADLEATLPGGGTLVVDGSRIPGEFVTWCRSNGKGTAPENAPPKPAADAPSSAPPAR